jgi:hypothetical protein
MYNLISYRKSKKLYPYLKYDIETREKNNIIYIKHIDYDSREHIEHISSIFYNNMDIILPNYIYKLFFINLAKNEYIFHYNSLSYQHEYNNELTYKYEYFFSNFGNIFILQLKKKDDHYRLYKYDETYDIYYKFQKNIINKKYITICEKNLEKLKIIIDKSFRNVSKALYDIQKLGYPIFPYEWLYPLLELLNNMIYNCFESNDEISEKMNKIDKLKKEIEILKIQIKYMPNGEGYHEALNHFTSLIKN